MLLKRAQKVWLVLDCTFEKINDNDWVGLDEMEIDFTGKRIYQYKFLTDLNPVSDWTTMYKDVCKLLLTLDRTSFVSLIAKEFPENPNISNRFSDKSEKMGSPAEIEPGIYIETRLNTQTKIEMLRVLFSHFNIDYQDLLFKINEDENLLQDISNQK